MSLTERIRRIASDVDEAGPQDPTLRGDFQAFKDEVTAQLEDLRKDLQQLLEASQHEQGN